VSRPEFSACRNEELVLESDNTGYFITNGVTGIAVDPQTFEETEQALAHWWRLE
jgi:hypothetical protein